MIQWARSLLFVAWMYALMGAMGILCAPLALWSRKGAWWSIHRYTGIVLWSLRWMCGLRTEVRGEVPRGDVLVAAKHQSFLDIIILADALERPRFVMKQSLRWAPVLGFYAHRIGCPPVDRGARSRAVRRMIDDMGAEGALDGQTVIYPQGTRVAPGVKAPWKIGVAALYEAGRLPLVPAATNGGVFWARMGVLRRPGLATVEFLTPIPPGLERGELMERIETEVEAASDRLLQEARAARPA